MLILTQNHATDSSEISLLSMFSDLTVLRRMRWVCSSLPSESWAPGHAWVTKETWLGHITLPHSTQISSLLCHFLPYFSSPATQRPVLKKQLLFITVPPSVTVQNVSEKYFKYTSS
jgi:hypothetical protein